MAAFAYKLSVTLLLVSMISTVQADEYCDAFTRLVDDFADELNSTFAEDLFDRVCIDVMGEDSVEYCQDFGKENFGEIRELLQSGLKVEDLCCLLFADCTISSNQKAKFAKIRSSQLFFKSQFQKLMFGGLKAFKTIKGSKLVKAAKN